MAGIRLVQQPQKKVDPRNPGLYAFMIDNATRPDDAHAVAEVEVASAENPLQTLVLLCLDDLLRVDCDAHVRATRRDVLSNGGNGLIHVHVVDRNAGDLDAFRHTLQVPALLQAHVPGLTGEGWVSRKIPRKSQTHSLPSTPSTSLLSMS